MEEFVLSVGLGAAVPLVALLAATLHRPRLGVWPTPEPGTWQSNLFWVLFRTANTASIALAVVAGGGFLDLDITLRAAALAIAIGASAAFLISLTKLGQENSYCARDGLVSSGVYRFTRNPQYIALVAVHGGLAIAADTFGAYTLAGLLIAIYWLMARLEEPWLRAAYGQSYDAYAATVPRFVDLRSLRELVRVATSLRAARREAIQSDAGPR